MKALDQKIQVLHETYWEDEREAARGKTVVLVEGDDDRDMLDAVFRQRRKTWETRVRIVVAGGRQRVIERMSSTFPAAYGLVDRDTWTDEEVVLQQEENPDRLFVTTGWCLENVFFDPHWLEAHYPKVMPEVAHERERWVRAGALWWVLQRTREAQQRWQDCLVWSYGAPSDDLDLGSAPALVDSLRRRIPEEVRTGARLDFDALANGFARRCDEILALSEAEQWRLGIHGKRAFRKLLIPALQRAHGQRIWGIELARDIGTPAPIDTLLAMLLP
jgi:hypothetical protein